MKSILLLLLSMWYLNTNAQDHNLEQLKKDILEMELTLNARIIDAYITYCKEYKVLPAVYGIGSFIDIYNQQSPCKEARERFVEASEQLVKILKAEAPQYSDTISREKKGEIFRHLNETSEKYREARAIEEEALRNSNILLLETLLKDFQQKKVLIPTKFIHERIMEYIKQLPGLDLLEAKLQMMKEIYLEKTKQELEAKYN